ncbi:MAG: S46 family peptidase [Planctomycetota bacterium]
MTSVRSTVFATALALAAVLALAMPAKAQDHHEMGKMWTFEHVPKDYFQKTHGFELTQEWLDHARMSSLRFGGGCSASFVSPKGLIMTNHHCTRDFIAQASPENEDWVRDGFVAESMEKEVKLEGCSVQQLVRTRDITELMNRGIEDGDDDATVTRKRAENEQAILKQAREESPDLNPEVIKLYQGGVFMLYSYRFYTDVRLVVAPHLQTSHFGGDPDNFTYPRFGIDFTFCRAYENDKPVDSSSFYFQWDSGGAEEGESVFITGNPGRTSRLLSKSQLEVLRDITYPILLEGWEIEMDYIRAISAKDAEVEKQLRPRLLSLENSNKAVGGYLAGLRDPSLMSAKAKAERALRDAVDADPELSARYGDAWDRLTEIARQKRACEPRRRLYRPSVAGPIVERAYAALRATDDADRNAKIAAEIARIDVALDGDQKERLARDLSRIGGWMGRGDELVAAIAAHGGAAEMLDAMAEKSLFADDDKIAALLAGGADAVANSDDPALAVARILRDGGQESGRELSRLGQEEEVQKVRVGQAAFAVYGFTISPDATFSLRLSDGKVAGYPCNGTLAPHQTVFYGLFARNVEFGNRYPFNLPDIWRERAYRIDMVKPVNFVATNDIIGGNSGSPVIDKDRRVVGLVFDGNIEMLPNNFFYRDDIPRSVSVHTAAMEECLTKIYDAQRVVDELKGK